MARCHALLLLALALLLEPAESHAVMVAPVPRRNIVVPANSNCNWITGDCPIGTKLSNFNDAVSVANRGCGGTANNDPGASGWQPPYGGNISRPSFVAPAGSLVTVTWALTVPHRADIVDSGVRIALHYANSDSFDCNVLAENVRAGPDLPDGEVQQTPPLEVSVAVDLPLDKTCDYCVLQFMWAARNDDGFYISCADIAIVGPNDEQKSQDDYWYNIPEERGELPRNPNYVKPAGYTCSSNVGGGGDNGGVVATVVILLLIAAAAGGYFLYKRNQGGGGGGGATFGSGIPSPPPAPGGGSGGLPPGWREVPDPASGRSYFVNDGTGETSWERPKAAGGGVPPPPGGAAPPGLPPGWQAALDPASGRQYYVHASSGATSWEVPSYA